ncbi:MAG TPA: hypothetical protein VG676_06560 [Chitinophagaceae bacterium]|jgi:hypothetical protein|nr:hypothetical protein [Chitinophagaceae bacterium]
MEVHHHPHTEVKRLKHYLFEFFMLFLAVFCGFIAEYLLEHKIDKEKGMKYLHSFYEDLKTDTANFSSVIKEYEKKQAAFLKAKDCFDSIHSQLSSPHPCLADLFRYAQSFPDLVNADQTLQQLKNAGGLRLLKDPDADSILGYDKLLRDHMRRETTGFQDIQNKLRETINHMINYKNLKSNEVPATSQFLYTTDPELLNYFFVSLDYYSNYCSINLQSIKEIKQKGISLIKYFKNKYHFD